MVISRPRQTACRWTLLALANAAACTPASIAPTPAVQPVALWGFTAPWDARSDSSLGANAARLDVVVTGWIQLDSVTGQPSRLYADTSRIPASAGRLALVTSWHGQRFHPETVRRLAGDPLALASSAAHVADLVSSGRYRGIVLDLEAHSQADTGLTMRVVRAFSDSVRRRGASTIALAIPAGDTSAYPTRALAPLVDYLVVMLYDEHWSTSGPGPIATPSWVRRTLGQRVAEVGASRIVAALPLYGYLWRPNQPTRTLGFDDARRAAIQASVELSRDPSSRSLRAIQPGAWELWMSDAELLRALRAEVSALGVTRIALWRLGLEDPSVWSVLRPK